MIVEFRELKQLEQRIRDVAHADSPPDVFRTLLEIGRALR